MNRIEKKEIRLRMINILDSRCKGCMMRSGYEAQQYCINHCEVSYELQQLSYSLVNKEHTKIQLNNGKTKVKELKSGRWDQDEVLYLENHMKLFDVEHLSMKLNREPQSVYNKIQQLKFKHKTSACYSI